MKIKRAWHLLTLLLIGSLFTGATAPLSAGEAKTPTVLALRGGTVFDSLKGVLLPDQTIVIRGDRIEQVGSRASVKIPRGARVINAQGKFIIPGLMDAHVHLVHQLDFAQITSDEVLPMFLAAGVTSLRDVGDTLPPQRLVQRFADEHPERS